MKIGDITFVTPLQKFGKQSPYLPLSEAGTRVAAADMVAKGFGAFGDLAKDMYQRQVKIDVDKARHNQIVSMRQFEADNAGKLEYTQEDLPSDLQTQPGANRRRYEVYPDLRYNAFKKTAQASADLIYDADAKRNFIVTSNRLAEEQYQKDLVEAKEQQLVVRRQDQEQFIDDFIQTGDYEAARVIANEFEGTEQERKQLKNRINISSEIDPIRNTLAQPPSRAKTLRLEADLVNLRKSNEDYDGHLSQQKRLELVNAIEAELYRDGQAGRASTAAANKQLIWEGRKLRDALGNGYHISDERTFSIVNQLQGVDDQLAQDILIETVVQKESAELATIPFSASGNILDMSRASASQDPITATIHNKKVQARKRNWQRFTTDSASYAIDTGVNTPVAFDPNDMPGTLQQLNRNYNKTLATWGSSTGPLTDSQSLLFSNLLSQITDTRNLGKVFSDIEQNMSDNSSALYEQLIQKGLSDTLPMAGKLHSIDPIASNMIIEGRRIRTEFPELFKHTKVDLEEAISQEVGLTYRDKPGMNKLIKESIKDVYAYYHSGNGKQQPAIIETIDDEILTKAINNVTGGLIELNGRKVEPPSRGFPQEEMEDYITAIKLSDLARMGMPIGFTLSQLRSDMQEGNIDYYSAGENEYHLFHTLANTWIKDQVTGGGAFVFRYLEGSDYVPNVIEGYPISQTEKENIVAERIKGSVAQDREIQKIKKRVKENARKKSLILNNKLNQIREGVRQVGDYLTKPVEF